jgi:hypothetical protein
MGLQHQDQRQLKGAIAEGVVEQLRAAGAAGLPRAHVDLGLEQHGLDEAARWRMVDALKRQGLIRVEGTQIYAA